MGLKQLTAGALVAVAVLAAAPIQAEAASARYWKNRALDLRDSRDHWKGEARAQRYAAVARTRERDAAQAQVASLTGQVSDLTTRLSNATYARDRALEGLPGAISAAVMSGAAWEKVFMPLRSAWRCDSLYQAGSYWSIEFDSSC
jgi:hypothetical protein